MASMSPSFSTVTLHILNLALKCHVEAMDPCHEIANFLQKQCRVAKSNPGGQDSQGGQGGGYGGQSCLDGEGGHNFEHSFRS